jgi:amidase
MAGQGTGRTGGRTVPDPAFASTTEIAAALRDRKLGSLELLDHLLARCERHNGRLNAIVAWDVAAARERARAADTALAGGECWGPLHGVPMTIKDAIEVTGMPTTSGAPELREHRAAENAPVAQRAIDAGAVVFGKTNLPLYAGDFQSFNDVYGQTNNPWDLARVPGGSSGGAAAALAAGLTGFEIGSDIGGSLRNPAHYCGVYALKPSYGIVPQRGHIPGPPGIRAEPDIAVLGPMGRSAADLALGLDVLAGPDTDDAKGWRLALPAPRHERLREFSVGVWLEHPICPIEGEVAERLEAAVTAVARAGARIDAKTRPVDGADAFSVYLRLLFGVLANGFPPEALAGFDAAAAGLVGVPGTQPEIVRAIAQRHREWVVTNEQRAQMRVAWERYFETHDVLLAPVMPTVAFPHDHSEYTTRTIVVNGTALPYIHQLFWAGLTNVVYLPAVAAPVGLARSGLPVGIQIVAPYLEDRTAIRFAALLADAIGGFVAPPGFA